MDEKTIIKQLFADFSQWLQTDFLAIASLQQIASILGLALFSYLMSQHLPRIGARSFKHPGHKRFFQYLHDHLREIAFFLTWSLSLWILVWYSANSDMKYEIIKVSAISITTLALIKTLSTYIEESPLITVLAIFSWVIAALLITDLYDPVIHVLGKLGVDAGGYHLSILTLIEGILTFTLLITFMHITIQEFEKKIRKVKHFNDSQKILFLKMAKIFFLIAIVIIGLNSMGLDPTAITIFSGAFGVGLGFGLQKVFSNLISGIIILLDKSIKPGTVIAIEDTYGWVNTLEARYTSVLTRDGVEHLIPNENLVTNRVENWSFSSNELRLTMIIGVHYNSDLRVAMQQMLDATKEHARIIDAPAPTCVLTAFNDSSVDFELRFWVQDPAHGIENIKGEVLLSVWDKFKEHNIEIPYPQRDLYLKTMPKSVS